MLACGWHSMGLARGERVWRNCLRSRILRLFTPARTFSDCFGRPAWVGLHRCAAMRLPKEHGRSGGERQSQAADEEVAWWVTVRLAFVAGVALGFAWGVAVALGTGAIGKWLRGEL